MARRSTIKTLPKEILAEVNRLLIEGVATLDEIVAHLRKLEHPRSRSALGRYKKHFDRVAARIQQSREMAEALVAELGPAAAEGKTGRMLVEILQNLTFNHLLNRVEDEDGTSAKDLMMLSRALREMAAAGKLDVDREVKIRKEIVTQAAEAAAKVGKKRGISPKVIREIETQVLGLVRP